MADKSQTITKIEVTHNPVPHGQGFSVSAHVTPAGPNRVHGDVDFTCDGAALGTARTDSTGVAAIGVPGGLIHAGAHEFGAAFHGDAYNDASTAEVLSVVMAPAEGEAWPAEDKVEKFTGSAPADAKPAVEPVVVPEPHVPPAPDPLAPQPVDLSKPIEPAPLIPTRANPQPAPTP
jgi:hypothetical protein